MKPVLTALVWAMLASSVAGAAENTVFVTDELRLGLYPDETTSGRPTRMLTSGDQLRILDRALRSMRVRTDNGDVGWVKSGYVVEKEPARRLIVPLQAQSEKLTASLDAMTAEKDAMAERITELDTELESAKEGIVALPELQKEVAALQDALDQRGASVHLNWLIAAAAAAFVFGCIAGYYWLDRRVRKRFGGLRIY